MIDVQIANDNSKLNLIDLSQGDTGCLMMPRVLQALKDILHSLYTNGTGAGREKFQPEELVRAAKKYLVDTVLDHALQVKVKIDNVVISHLSSTMLFKSVLKSFCKNRNYAIITAPYFKGYPRYASDVGVKLYSIELFDDTDYKLVPEELEKHILLLGPERVGALIMVLPVNPFGSVYSRKELEELSKILLKYNIKIISDELFHQTTIDHVSIANIMVDQESMLDHSFVIFGNSKSHNVGSIGRIGVGISGNKTIINEVRNIVNNALPPFQQDFIFAACAVLENTTKEDIELNRRAILSKLHYANQVIDKINKELGGEYIMVLTSAILFVCFTLDSKILKALNIIDSIQLQDLLLDKLSLNTLPFKVMGSDIVAVRANVCGCRDYLGKISDGKIATHNLIDEVFLRIKLLIQQYI